MLPEPYKEYLVYFHGPRDYFECHEVLEEYWKEAPLEKREDIWVGFIQIAVALYHQRLQNYNGASRLLKNAISILEKQQEKIESLGLQFDELIVLLTNRYKEIINKEPYYSINLPINDNFLLEECITSCKQFHVKWGEPSDLENESIIKKHVLRDRTDVIKEREREKQKRRDLY